jgi:hypothetical protein
MRVMELTLVMTAVIGLVVWRGVALYRHAFKK